MWGSDRGGRPAGIPKSDEAAMNAPPNHVAVIDLGSNTARLVLIAAIPGYSYRLQDEIGFSKGSGKPTTARSCACARA